MKKRFFSLLVSLFLLSTLVNGAYALEEPASSGAVIPVGEYTTTLNSGQTVYNESYYNQLNHEQKNAYDALVGLPTYDTVIAIDLLTPINFTSNSSQPTLSEMEPMLNELRGIIQVALDAFLRDNALIFWLDLSGDAGSTSYGLSYSFVRRIGSTYYWKVETVDFYAVVAEKYNPNTADFVTAVTDAVEAFETVFTTRYDILKDIHDYLCNTVVYDLNALYAHEPYGALVAGIAVCEGYAEAFKLLCDRFNIPCAVILGLGVAGSGSEPHMWNYVQMEDGKWYAVDVTWDDQVNMIYYDFFLVGAETVATNFGTGTFSQSHVEDGVFSYGSPVEFVYPLLNSTAYQPDSCRNGHIIGEWEVVFEPTETSEGLRVKKCEICGELLESETLPVLLPNAILLEDSTLVLADGYLLGISENTTVLRLTEEFNGVISVTDADGTLLQDEDLVGTGCTVDLGRSSYSVVILGDVDGNGIVTSVDYLIIKRVFIGSYTIGDAYLKAACISGASFPTSVDYLMIKRHFLGSYNIYNIFVG